MLSVVVGGFFGDEGKGKIISYLTLKDNISIIARGGVGPNAGHTIEYNKTIYKVRMLPSGFLNTKTKLCIGPGVVIDPTILINEIKKFNVSDRIFIDTNCGIIEKKHRTQDTSSFLNNVIGSTGSGTGPANSERAMRTLQLAHTVDSLLPFVSDVVNLINSVLDSDENILIEGTQGTFLSLWHGTYPFVTSKDVTASAICADVGIGPKKVDEVIIVFKSYVTRVGKGPLHNELSLSAIQDKGWSEKGTVTGRQRRAAEFDIDLAKRSIMINSATQIALTKLDLLFPNCIHKTNYNDLDDDAKQFIEQIETSLSVPITLIGTGPDVYDVIDRRTKNN